MTSGIRACPECREACAIDAQFCSQCGFPVGAVSLGHHDPMIGRVLPGGYQVVDLLGVGGMGRVYRAQQRALGRTVAIKIVHPHLSSEEKSLARFLTEARATSQLNHPNTVSVIDFGKTDDGQPYLVMEFLRGKNLAQIVAAEGLLPLPRLLRIVHQILLALGEAHALNIIHRDLKPENIIVEPLRRGGDFVKVVDFGLAKLKADEEQPGITMPGIVCGTPDFMAPEQGRGDPIDGRSDLYAVGVVLFWLLTGRLPFEAGTPTQVVMMHITNPVPSLHEMAPHRRVPESVQEILYHALEKNPDLRFRDAHEFADAIADVLQSFDRGSWLPSERPTVSMPVTVPASAVSCPHCHAVVPWARFCFECGGALPQNSSPPRSETLLDELPFIGREDELSRLRSLYEQLPVHGTAVRIVGESGYGKSRLLREFLRELSDLGAQTVFARPDPFWAEVPGYALASLIEQLAPETLLRAAATETSKPIQLALSELLEGSESPLPPDERRASYRDALVWALNEAEPRQLMPVVVALDDLDRIDGLTRQAVRDVLELGVRPNVLVLGAHAAHFVEPWPELEEPACVLGGLPSYLASELLRRGLNNGPQVTLAETTGVGLLPLYVEQVLHFAREGGSDPPARVADLIAERISALDGALRACVQALAVLGDQVEPDLLDEFLREEHDASTPLVNETVDRLVEPALVMRDAGGRLSLRHPMLREVILSAIPVLVRQELHRRAGKLLRVRGAGVEVLAEHAVQGQDIVPALFLLEQAATRASSRGDDATATHLLRRGLDLTRQELSRGELDDPLSAVVIFGRKLGETLKRRGLLADAKGVLLEVLDATAPRGAPRTEVLALLAEVAQRDQRWDEAERLLDQALSVARDSDAPEGLVEGLQLRLHSVRTAHLELK